MSLLDDCYVGYLNMEHRNDRLAHINAEFKKAGLKGVRTEGRKPETFDLNDPKLQVMKNRTSGAIGCHYGQVEIMQKALEKKKHAFVFEDDVILCDDFQGRMAMAEDFLKEKDWQIFWLGGTYHYPEAWWHKVGHSEDLQQCNCTLGVDAAPTEHPNFMRTYGAFSTHCYIVNKDFIFTLMMFLEANVHQSMGIDWIMILLQPKIHTYAPNPGMAIQLDNQSDIGVGFSKFSGFAMLGSHWFSDKV